MICANLQSAEDVVSTLGTLSKPCPDCGHHVLAHRFTTKVCDACIADAAHGPIDGRYIITFPDLAPEMQRKWAEVIFDHFKKVRGTAPLLMFGDVRIEQVVE